MASLDNLQEFTFTLLSSPTLSKPSYALDLFPLSGDDEHWIKKWLSSSDVNSSSRLLLAKKDVKKYVLPSMDDESCAACHSSEGLRVKMWDMDDTGSEHELSLKQWKPGSFLLTSNWSKDFVKRKKLKKGDCIGLRWDPKKLGFFFRKFNNAQS